jgi:hypothetical protein
MTDISLAAAKAIDASKSYDELLENCRSYAKFRGWDRVANLSRADLLDTISGVPTILGCRFRMSRAERKMAKAWS